MAPAISVSLWLYYHENRKELRQKKSFTNGNQKTIIRSALRGVAQFGLECLLGVQEVACSSQVTPTQVPDLKRSAREKGLFDSLSLI